MQNMGCLKIFSFYLVDLIAQGERETVGTIGHEAANGTLVDYMKDKYPSEVFESCGEGYFDEINDAVKGLAYDGEKFCLKDGENGLSVLLCNIIDDLFNVSEY